MDITTTDFEYNYHNSQKVNNNICGKYVLHNVDVHNTIIVDGIELQALYRTAQTYLHNQFNCPNYELELTHQSGTDEVLIIIDNLCADHFNEEYINDTLEAVNARCSVIDTVDKLRAVYDALNDNLPNIGHFLNHEIYTDNFDDYEEDESTGLLTLRD